MEMLLLLLQLMCAVITDAYTAPVLVIQQVLLLILRDLLRRII
jgi:hypothetical protein